MLSIGLGRYHVNGEGGGRGGGGGGVRPSKQTIWTPGKDDLVMYNWGKRGEGLVSVGPILRKNCTVKGKEKKEGVAGGGVIGI